MPCTIRGVKYNTVIATEAVIANEVKPSMTSNCMDCHATIAVTQALLMVRGGIGADSDRAQGAELGFGKACRAASFQVERAFE